MKVFWTVLKVLAALAAIAAVVYVIIAYGEKIKAWFQNLLGKFSCCSCGCDCDCDCDCVEEDFAG